MILAEIFGDFALRKIFHHEPTEDLLMASEDLPLDSEDLLLAPVGPTEDLILASEDLLHI